MDVGLDAVIKKGNYYYDDDRWIPETSDIGDGNNDS
jgi:hypothetical protein